VNSQGKDAPPNYSLMLTRLARENALVLCLPSCLE
jgi:hypothetical protein